MSNNPSEPATPSQHDHNQVLRYGFDDTKFAHRMTLVDGNISLNAEMTPVVNAINELKEITKELSLQPNVIVEQKESVGCECKTQTNIQKIEVPVIVEKIVFKEIPVIVKELEIKEIKTEVPVFIEKSSSQSFGFPKVVIICFMIQAIASVGMFFVSLLK